MIKKNLRLIILTSAIILLPAIAGLILWQKLPDKIAIHFNAQGVADNFSGKAFAVFGLPLFLLAMQWICILATYKDPKSKNIGSKMFGIVLWIVPAISLLIGSILYSHTLEIDINISFVCSIFFGFLFVIMGNYLPKLKQNRTVGFKNSWTAESEKNWASTHRFAGRLWVAGGIIIILTSFFELNNLFFIICMALFLAPNAYSYLFHRKHKQF